MNDESEPLIQRSRLQQRSKRQQSVVCRFCGIAIGSTVLFICISFVFPVLLFAPAGDFVQQIIRLPTYLPWWMPIPRGTWPLTEGLSFDDLKEEILTTPDPKKIREWSKYYTSGPHLAGQNYSQALWTQELWKSFGIESKIVSYDVLLSYPLDHRLALLEVSGKKSNNYSVVFEASLKEDAVKKDRTSGLDNRIPTFHGYSANGNATGSFVFANYGTVEDYKELATNNISIKDKIVIVKYGRVMRGIKVSEAAKYGAIGCLIYTDPGDDGEITEANGYKVYPDGPARQPSSVQRGSVSNLGLPPGDPTTPGYASHPGVPRKSPSDVLVSIPSIPISYLDAIPILKALKGYGPKASSLGKYWEGGGLGYKGVEYFVGPSPDNLVLNLYNSMNYTITPLWDVIGVINGTLKEDAVVLGNHRDAWIAGGAADPNSGSAALNEVVRSFGKALKKGYKPLRTIVFASWDGEEYALIGSTEWVEDNLKWLQKSAIAYLNVDVATAGPILGIGSSPLLNGLIKGVSKMIPSPNQTVEGQSLYDAWSKKISPLGSGSDYTAFLDFAGIPSADIGFHPGPLDPPYHYHSNFDSFDWMEKYGDPGWKYHTAAAKLWGLLAIHLLEKPVIPFNVTDYADALISYVEKTTATIDQIPTISLKHRKQISLSKLNSTVYSLKSAAVQLDKYAAHLSSQVSQDIPWWKWWKKVALYYKILGLNASLKYFERSFLYDKGLDGRTWFKHVIYSPGITTGYAGAQFPGLVESIAAKNWTNAERWTHIISERVSGAARRLNSTNRSW